MTDSANVMRSPGLSWRQRFRGTWWRIAIRIAYLDLARARFLHDKPSIVDDLLQIGRRRLQQRDLERAHVVLLAAHDLAVKIAYESRIARAEIGLAEVNQWRGDSKSVVEQLETALPQFRRLRAEVRLTYALCMLGEALLDQDRPGEALEAFREAEHEAEYWDDWKERTKAIYGRGRVAYHEGRFDEAIENWKAAMHTYQRHRDAGGVAHMQHWLSMAAGSQRRVDESRQFALDSIRSYEKAGRPDIAERGRDYLAEIDEFIASGGFTQLDEEP